jgi:tRNA threonylcarbamoyladenosine biosynthesis protein TsaB
VALSAIDLFAVASGPGSFTGMRIGIATMQGLAFVAGRRVVGVPALEAIAHAASVDLDAGALVAAWMDAYRREVFSALYRVSAAALFDPARLVEVDPASVGDPDGVLRRWREQCDGARPVFAGDGAATYADRIRTVSAAATIVEPRPLAGAIGRLAVAHAERGEAVDPAAIRPLYVRRPDAELARDKRLP